MKRRMLSLAALLLAFSATLHAATIQVDVNGLVCAFCAQGIERTLRRFPQVRDVLVSLEHRLVAIEVAPDADLDDATLTRAITDAGYAVVRIRRGEASLDAIRAGLADGEARQ